MRMSGLAGLVVLLLALIVAGCVSPFGLPEPEADKVFLLAPSMPGPPGLDPRGPSILVSRPHAAAGFAGAQMIYAEEPYQLESFAHHRWADTPADMLEPLLVETLEASRLFRSVAAAGTRARTDLRLDTELLRLVQVFEEGQSRVEVALRASLIGVPESRLLGSRVLTATEAAAEANPCAGVAAANRAVVRILGELQLFLNQSVGH